MTKRILLIDDDDGRSGAEFLPTLEATRLDLNGVVASTGDEAIAVLGSVECLVAADSTPSGQSLPVLRHVAAIGRAGRRGGAGPVRGPPLGHRRVSLCAVAPCRPGGRGD